MLIHIQKCLILVFKRMVNLFWGVTCMNYFSLVVLFIFLEDSLN